MASLGHIAVGMAAGRWWNPARPGRAMLGLSALAMLPDADVIGMACGVPYGAPWGHRGATHSIAIALVTGAAFAWLARRSTTRPVAAAFVVAILVAVSHGLLDAMTDGGRGIALLWPMTTTRYFFPWRPIPVAPIGLGFLSEEGLAVAAWEAALFMPVFAYALWPRRWRRTLRP
jgi:inner membrane protein